MSERSARYRWRLKRYGQSLHINSLARFTDWFKGQVYKIIVKEQPRQPQSAYRELFQSCEISNCHKDAKDLTSVEAKFPNNVALCKSAP